MLVPVQEREDLVVAAVRDDVAWAWLGRVPSRILAASQAAARRGTRGALAPPRLTSLPDPSDGLPWATTKR